MELRLQALSHVATLGIIEVDAQTRELTPLTAQQIRAIQDQANELITRLTPEATATF